MQNTIFYKLGKLIHSLRWFLIVFWVVLMLACIPFLPHITSPFNTTGFDSEKSESATTERFINKKLGYTNNNTILVLYSSSTLSATDPRYINKIKKSLSGLDDFPIKHEIFLPNASNKQISKDKHTAYAVIILKTNEPISDSSLAQLESLIQKPTNMTMYLGGEPIFVENVNKQTEVDLYKADMVGGPVAIVTLILVFGSIIAGLLPIVLGGGSALMILTSLYFLGHVFPLSIFTLNIALLLGLCLSLDYSLFVISRFRDELAHKKNVKEAISIAQATAGKAVFYSGIAVFISLSALLLFPINILFSVAIGGMAAVFFAVLTAVIVLPAILAVLYHKINLLSIHLFKRRKQSQSQGWRVWAKTVVGRPWIFFLSILSLLLILGSPVLTTKLGVSDFRIFPEKSQSRLFFDKYTDTFNEAELTPILMSVRTGSHSILSRKNLSKLYDLTHELKQNPLIEEVNSIVTTSPELSKKQYAALYKLDSKLLDPKINQLIETTTRQNFTLITLVTKYPINSAETKTLIADLSQLKTYQGLEIGLTGTPVDNWNVLNIISERLHLAIIWIMVFTYLILLMLLRSIFLPLKAILMNLLSLSACYGALVFVFQDGHFHQWLNFQPQGMLDISLLVIIFCAVFGFSMDYEVFLLTRIKESYQSTHDNDKSIIFGIEKSSRIITSAALIVIFMCGSFLVADVLMVKAFGVGIAMAIFVDAFLIRTILVPATMSLLKSWNWYLPKWLNKVLPKS